jgi:hypothetical protein
MVLKFDLLQKHASCHKATIGQYYMSSIVKNEWQFATFHRQASMVGQVVSGDHVEWKTKFMEFVMIFHLLKQW